MAEEMKAHENEMLRGFPPMRPQMELQRVHDLLMTVFGDPLIVKTVVPEELRKPLQMVWDCLCWCLHHDVTVHPESHASNFADLIFWLEHDLHEMIPDWGNEDPRTYQIIEED